MNKQECLIELNNISKLEYDWDNNRSSSISKIVINRTKALLETIDYKYVCCLYPSSRGIEIQLSTSKLYPYMNITITTEAKYVLICYSEDLCKDYIADTKFIVDKIAELFKNGW